MPRLLAVMAMAAAVHAAGAGPGRIAAVENSTLTAVPGVKVGHITLRERPTGCTVILTEGGAVAGVDVRGAAPGTRETDLLSPLNSVEHVHAIVLAGGSAFGLDAASGAVRWLEEHGIGFDVTVARVPIVPAAVLYDLPVGDARIRPTAECGYRAAAAASERPVGEGSVGAGAGATVGKLRGLQHAVKGGIGSAAIRLPDGLVVAALAATNGVGDVIDPATGKIVAGVRGDDGRTFMDARRLLREGLMPPWYNQHGRNTTLGVIATNARLTKAQATKVAGMAHDGLARAIAPVHTPSDGDTVFALATGTHEGDAQVFAVGALAADVMAEAIIRGVRQAASAGGVPALRDLE